MFDLNNNSASSSQSAMLPTIVGSTREHNTWTDIHEVRRGLDDMAISLPARMQPSSSLPVSPYAQIPQTTTLPNTVHPLDWRGTKSSYILLPVPTNNNTTHAYVYSIPDNVLCKSGILGAHTFTIASSIQHSRIKTDIPVCQVINMKLVRGSVDPNQGKGLSIEDGIVTINFQTLRPYTAKVIRPIEHKTRYTYNDTAPASRWSHNPRTGIGGYALTFSLPVSILNNSDILATRNPAPGKFTYDRGPNTAPVGLGYCNVQTSATCQLPQTPPAFEKKTCKMGKGTLPVPAPHQKGELVAKKTGQTVLADTFYNDCFSTI